MSLPVPNLERLNIPTVRLINIACHIYSMYVKKKFMIQIYKINILPIYNSITLHNVAIHDWAYIWKRVFRNKLLCITSFSDFYPPPKYDLTLCIDMTLSNQWFSKRLSLHQLHTRSSRLFPTRYIVGSLQVNLFMQHNSTKTTKTAIDVVFVPFHWMNQWSNIHSHYKGEC